MHRFFIDTILSEDQTVQLPSDEAKHAAKVLRLNKGANVALLDGHDIFKGIVSDDDPQDFRITVGTKLPSPEPFINVNLYQGIPKADKFSFIVQKCTEVGVHDITPIVMNRSISKIDKESKLQRFRKIAQEAAKQSGRAYVPNINKTCTWASAKDLMLKEDFIIVPWEDEHTVSLNKIQFPANIKNIGIVIGPEGGMESQEIDYLKKEFRAVSVSLGKRILRTETAGIVSCFATLMLLDQI